MPQGQPERELSRVQKVILIQLYRTTGHRVRYVTFTEYLPEGTQLSEMFEAIEDLNLRGLTQQDPSTKPSRRVLMLTTLGSQTVLGGLI